MDEAGWLACTYPGPMLDFLYELYENSRLRKERLFACACVRRVWHLLTDDRSQEAVDEAERYADGVGYEEDRRLLFLRAGQAIYQLQGSGPREEEDTVRTRRDLLAWRASCSAAEAARLAAARSDEEPDYDPILDTADLVVEAASEAACSNHYATAPAELAHLGDLGARTGAAVAERAAQAALLRDLFGNPFRPVVLDPTWRTSDVLGVARGAYEKRLPDQGAISPQQLTILADALEEAGCSDANLLDHLRSPGPHVRGCWVLDLILAKE